MENKEESMKVLIIAKKTSKCRCGLWVNKGESITWDTKSHKTVGCKTCKQTGYPPDQLDPPDIEWDGR